jgi:hypothetical protein
MLCLHTIEGTWNVRVPGSGDIYKNAAGTRALVPHTPSNQATVPTKQGSALAPASVHAAAVAARSLFPQQPEGTLHYHAALGVWMMGSFDGFAGQKLLLWTSATAGIYPLRSLSHTRVHTRTHALSLLYTLVVPLTLTITLHVKLFQC